MPSVVATSQPKTDLGRSDTHGSQHVSTRSLLVAFSGGCHEAVFVRQAHNWLNCFDSWHRFQRKPGPAAGHIVWRPPELDKAASKPHRNVRQNTHTHAEVTSKMFKKSNPRLQDLTEQLLQCSHGKLAHFKIKAGAITS